MYARNDADINEIKQWMSEQKFLPQDVGTAFIHTFLLGCQGNKEKAKVVLSNYFYVRQSVPDIFYDRDPLLPKNIEAWKYSWFLPLKGRQNGCRVYIGLVVDHNGYDLAAFAKQTFMCYDLIISNNEWDNGERQIVLGFEKLKRQNLLSFNQYITQKMIECERDNCMPGKLKCIHHVHSPGFMRKIHDQFKPHLTLQDEKRIFFHKNLASLHEYIDQSILPLEFGGFAGSLRTMADEWYKTMVSQRNFYIIEEEKRKQEAKGTGPKRT